MPEDTAGSEEGTTMPEREFDNHEAYRLMEQLVADTVTTLPDFPGFVERSALMHDCTDAQDNEIEGWMSIELKYAFDVPTSETSQVREDYTNLLRDVWAEEGYSINWDEASPTGDQYNLEASRTDGITLWWRVWGRTSLTIQSGCVPIGNGDKFPEYIPPAGGVPLDAEHDPIGDYLDPSIYGDAEPAEETSDEAAVNPFDDNVVADGSLPGRNPFTDQL